MVMIDSQTLIYYNNAMRESSKEQNEILIIESENIKLIFHTQKY